MQCKSTVVMTVFKVNVLIKRCILSKNCLKFQKFSLNQYLDFELSIYAIKISTTKLQNEI